MAKLVFAALIVAAIYYMFVRPRPRPAAKLPADEARAILGVGPEADPDAIRAAHRRLIAALHPDKGGSAELTRRINMARDTLLK